MSVDLFSADLSKVSGTDLYDAIIDFTRCRLQPDDRTQEGYTVDFKEKWSDKSLRVVAAFSNTFGGIIIVGVSEDRGKANQIVGEDSKTELKTRLASAIASSITPTPSFEVAECELPSNPGRRLCVIRVRATNRIHFLTTKNDSPVYIRNEDQAIPARAAELRSLIARERENASQSAQFVDENRVAQLLAISKSRKPEPGQAVALPRAQASSIIRVWIVPGSTCGVSLDYDTELTFRQIVFKAFQADSFPGDQTWNSSEATTRDKTFVRIDYAHVERDLESKWVLTNTGEFGYATVFAHDVPPGPPPLWSLSDLTLQLIASIKAAHAVLGVAGYLGDAQVNMFAYPGGGELYTERGALPFLRYSAAERNSRVGPAWRRIVPKPPNKPEDRWVTASVSSNFHTRTEAIAPLVADLLNQLLRDLGYGAVLAELTEYVKAVAG